MWMTVLIILIGGFTALYLWVWKKFQFFEEHGVPYEPGYFPFGSESNWKIVSRKIAFSDMMTDAYHNHKNDKLLGLFGFFGSKTLVVKDVDLIKDMLIKDSDHFYERRHLEVGDNPYIRNLLSFMPGDKAKTMRRLMSPIFTSGKLRGMVPLIDQIGDRFVKHLKTYADDDQDFEGKKISNHYTVEVISSCGFGIEVNSFDDPNDVFVQKLQKFITRSNIQIFLALFLPWLAKFTGNWLFDTKGVDFFLNIIKSQMEIRRKNPSVRNDFIDTLTQAMTAAKQEIDQEDEEDQFYRDAKIEASGKSGAFTKEELEIVIASNAFLLILAVTETSSTGLALTAFFLAKNQDCQDKAYQEIKDAIDANGGNQHLSYQAIHGLQYLEQCIHESLRMYPTGHLERKCMKDYKFKGTDFVVPKGMLVQICLVPIMKDEKYFPNPDQYNPENFSKQAVSERGPYSYLAFGHGPRNCIGKRFAILQLKAALARLIYNYKLVPSSRTVDKLEIDPASSSQQPKGGLWVKPIKRSET